jgi:two-component system phosphate regulon sensor histidine kinase PhoR
MNDGLFGRDFSLDDDVRLDGQISLFGQGSVFRLPTAPLARPTAASRPEAATESSHIRVLRERLRDAESDLSGTNAILALHPEPILVIDRYRTVMRSNPAAKALFGSDVRKGGLSAMLDEPDVALAVKRLFAGRGAQRVEFTLSGPVDRHLRAHLELLSADPPVLAAPANANTPPSHLQTAQPTALLTLTDLTEVKRTERLRADFVANASHELRTPLAVLLGFIETLTGPAADDPEAQRRFLGIMQQQANRMARLVDDLLSLSRIELTEHAPPTRRVQVAEIVGPVARALALRASERDMRIELVIAPDLPSVPGEPDELAQLFQNLIDNAIKYAKPGTAITVTAGRSAKLEGGVAVKVRDRGDGIAKRHLGRLTERFYRADNARASEMAGTGLGLAIVKHVVNRHHGLLDIESKLGRGSKFTVHLPAVSHVTDRAHDN